MDEVMMVAHAASLGGGKHGSSPSRNLLHHNLPIFFAFLAFAIVQFFKFFTNCSGGMPSSHSATVATLAIAIGLQEGAGALAFAITIFLACVVMYDASGVKLHAGCQAEMMNPIVCDFPPEHPLSTVRSWRELLDHTPIQVAAGGVLGCVVAYLIRSTI